MPVQVLSCTCVHPYQDSKYGKGNRIHNEALKKKAWRCSVCKREKS